MKQETLQLTGGSGQEKRRELDFYPTPKNVTVALMNFLFKEDRIDFNTHIWEPACGNGKMSKVLKEYCEFVYSSDKSDYGYGDPGIDYLTCHYKKEFDAIITNPPFGQSAAFIEKATKESRIVCMLLKSQYWHAKNKYDLYTKNPPAFVLPLTWRPDFKEDVKKENGKKKGGSTMEVFWCVWIRGINETKYKLLLKP